MLCCQVNQLCKYEKKAMIMNVVWKSIKEGVLAKSILGEGGKKEKVFFFAYKKEGFEVLCCVVAAVAVAAAFLRAKRF